MKGYGSKSMGNLEIDPHGIFNLNLLFVTNILSVEFNFKNLWNY